jgi:sec-independent protein translocase protein TatB
MFDIGWSEMAIIALVALLVLGPKELPQAMKSFAQFSKKMRRYANEFRAGVDNIVREAELEDAKKALDTVRAVNPKNAIKKLVDPTGEMTETVKSVETAAKDGTGKTIAKPIRPLPPGEQPKADPTGPAIAPAIATPALPIPEPVPVEPVAASESARRVSTPLQVAPPHSIRPPVEPAKVKPAPAAPEPPVEEAASDQPPPAAEARKQA